MHWLGFCKTCPLLCLEPVQVETTSFHEKQQDVLRQRLHLIKQPAYVYEYVLIYNYIYVHICICTCMQHTRRMYIYMICSICLFIYGRYATHRYGTYARTMVAGAMASNKLSAGLVPAFVIIMRNHKGLQNKTTGSFLSAKHRNRNTLECGIAIRETFFIRYQYQNRGLLRFSSDINIRTEDCSS